MRSYRNLNEIRRKEALGRRLSLIGLGVLFIGLLASFVPTWFPPTELSANPITRFVQQYWMWISFAALPLGFIFASTGSYFINRFARRRWPGGKVIARPDEMLERTMKGFDDKYAYFAWSLPANYVVSGPCGLLLLAARSDRGRVNVVGDRWREPFSFGRIFTVFAREGVGNPQHELEENTNKMGELLAQANGDLASELGDVPIDCAAVFLNPQVQLSLDSPTIPVLRSDQVKEYVRRRTREVKLPTQTVRKLNDFLKQQSQYQEAE